MRRILSIFIAAMFAVSLTPAHAGEQEPTENRRYASALDFAGEFAVTPMTIQTPSKPTGATVIPPDKFTPCIAVNAAIARVHQEAGMPVATKELPAEVPQFEATADDGSSFWAVAIADIETRFHTVIAPDFERKVRKQQDLVTAVPLLRLAASIVCAHEVEALSR